MAPYRIDRIALVLVLCSLAACAQQGQAPPPTPKPSPAKGTGMNPGSPVNFPLEVTLTSRGREFLSGAAIPLVVTLKNNMPAGGAFVHSQEASMPFIFRVEPEKGEPFDVSRELYQQRTMPNPPPPRPPQLAPIRAGQSLEYPVNLADFMTTSLKPGRYKVSVIYPLDGAVYRSAPIALEVVAPKTGMLEVAPNGDRVSLGAVFVQADAAGATVLYQRESEMGKPDVGPYHPRRTLRDPTSVALSTDGESATEPRWIAWTENGSASFLHVWAATELFASQPAALNANARLVSPGWTFDDESILFLAASNADLSLITLRNREQPRVRTFPIAGGIANPAALRAGFFKTQSDPPARRLLVVWPDGNRVMAALVNPDADATAARELARREEPLVALDIEPVGVEAAPIIHAVFSGAPADPAHLVRIRAGEEMQTTTLPALPEPATRQALQWKVLAGGNPAVAVQAGDHQILAWMPGRDWRSIHDTPQSAVSNLRLTPMQQAWAVWTDTADGVHYRALQP
ncbi:MAG TPA: hypothetical protein VER03_14325 [Bryobacteraceae bacterium]|nr:hypothetical protein [Bryobacteraceae bacterium]